MDLNIDKTFPPQNASSRPLNEDVPLPGPPVFSAKGDARNAAFSEAGLNTHTHGDYCAHYPDPVETPLPSGERTTGVDHSEPVPGAMDGMGPTTWTPVCD